MEWPTVFTARTDRNTDMQTVWMHYRGLTDRRANRATDVLLPSLKKSGRSSN